MAQGAASVYCHHCAYHLAPLVLAGDIPGQRWRDTTRGKLTSVRGGDEGAARNGGLADALVWDHGNREHATRHGVSQEEIDGMYEGGEWIIDDDPAGRFGQFRITGPTAVGRLITVAVEWLSARRAYRPISAWAAEARERRAWQEQMLER
jgi:uncharacterized DUF497 family protein